VAFDPNLAAMGTSEPILNAKGSTTYGFWNAAAIVNYLPIMTSDDPDVDRVWYDQYTNTGNYAFADGHAKSQALGATLIPQMGEYEYGDTFYPSINPADVSCESGG
jgi:prepilin-type processing-associated H-X9-DG protein